MNLLPETTSTPRNPCNGAYIQFKTHRFVTLNNAMLDTFGIYKVEKDWSDVIGLHLKHISIQTLIGKRSGKKWTIVIMDT